MSLVAAHSRDISRILCLLNLSRVIYARDSLTKERERGRYFPFYLFHTSIHRLCVKHRIRSRASHASPRTKTSASERDLEKLAQRICLSPKTESPGRSSLALGKISSKLSTKRSNFITHATTIDVNRSRKGSLFPSFPLPGDTSSSDGQTDRGNNSSNRFNRPRRERRRASAPRLFLSTRRDRAYIRIPDELSRRFLEPCRCPTSSWVIVLSASSPHPLVALFSPSCAHGYFLSLPRIRDLSKCPGRGCVNYGPRGPHRSPK